MNVLMAHSFLSLYNLNNLSVEVGVNGVRMKRKPCPITRALASVNGLNFCHFHHVVAFIMLKKEAVK